MTSGPIKKDILVVDDDLYLCDIIADVLLSEGHEVRTAYNGLEALDRIRERKPQLILLDLMMPVMSGWELTARLRQDPNLRDIPVVIITADYHANFKQHETGARAVITKPFDIDELSELVANYAT